MSDLGKQFRLDTWAKGEAITGAKLNQVVEALQYRRGIRPARQVAPNYANSDIIRQMQILSISGDTLTCALNDGSTNTDVLYTVARPVLLRRSLTSWNSITYTYSDDQTRVATPGGSQTVTPAYVIGDIIYAAQSVDGGPTVLDASGIPVDWFDINADGRVWSSPAVSGGGVSVAKAATTVNITLSGTQTVDGVSLNAGDYCLVKNQSSPASNGYYLVASGAWVIQSPAQPTSVCVVSGTVGIKTLFFLSGANTYIAVAGVYA